MNVSLAFFGYQKGLGVTVFISHFGMYSYIRCEIRGPVLLVQVARKLSLTDKRFMRQNKSGGDFHGCLSPSSKYSIKVEVARLEIRNLRHILVRNALRPRGHLYSLDEHKAFYFGLYILERFRVYSGCGCRRMLLGICYVSMFAEETFLRPSMYRESARLWLDSAVFSPNLFFRLLEGSLRSLIIQWTIGFL